MKTKAKLIMFAVIVSLIVGITGCSNREAATVGAMIGQRVGTVFGTAAVAVEETFETAPDIQAANPRQDHQPRPRQRSHDLRLKLQLPHHSSIAIMKPMC
ncbi:hypothetical protein ACFL6U_05090 [Planctomycetota bacterium]